MMTKKLLWVCAMMLCWGVVKARDEKYPVSAIPDALKQNVNAVVREDETVFRITSRKSATVHFHYVVTILNDNARNYAQKAIGYDKMRKVENVRAAVYNAEGETIKKLKSSEIYDRSAFGGSTLFSDARVKIFDLGQSQYPYTVDLEYDIDYDYLFFIDGSTVGAYEKTSVEHFKYQLIYPLASKPRYKAYNIEQAPVVAPADGGTESVTWILENVVPITPEPMSGSSESIKRIVAAPGNFEFSGYAGSMANWDDMGKWLKSLNEGRDKLSDETKQKVHELVAGLKTNEEKAKVLYEYMQSRTRYVSIQLGIGGFQPFEAITVDQTSYGDCKALSNYMVAMLKEAGVPSYYTIISAGRNQPAVDAGFPNSFANHVIVAVPNAADTIWLECTSQTNPFGYLGSFTGNRYGLMVTEQGGKLVKTTYYPTQQNVQSTVADVDLDATGNARAKVVTNYSGLQYENGGLSFVLDQTSDDQKKWIEKNTDIPSFSVGKFSFESRKERIPTAIVTVDLTLNKYASVSNKRIFLSPNLMNRLTSIPEKVENRKTPFVLGMGYTDIDTIRYHIPENIYPEFLPPDSRITSQFGTYESGFKLDQGSLIYIRKMTRKDGEFPAAAYQELVEFYKNISKADNTKVVFLNKT